MRLLVTGAGGFIGSAFTRLALVHGHEVAGLSSSPKLPPAHCPGSDQMRWLHGSLAHAPWSEIEQFQPDVCVHFAWIATPGAYLESPENENYLRWSLDFVHRLRALGVNHIVGAGTCIEYKITNAPLSEVSTPTEPTTPYGRCKNALRSILETEAQREGYTFCWGRVFYPYGPGEHPARLCTSLIQKFQRGEKLVLKTPHSTKDYIYIADLASAILLSVEKKFTGTINWGTGAGISVRKIADTVAGMLGRPELVSEVSPAEVDPLGFVVANASRLHQLGWRQSFNLPQGLQILSEQLGKSEKSQ